MDLFFVVKSVELGAVVAHWKFTILVVAAIVLVHIEFLQAEVAGFYLLWFIP